jgi:hypothetical protein
MSSKARLLRKKLKEQKEATKPKEEEKKEETNNPPQGIPAKKPPLLPSMMKNMNKNPPQGIKPQKKKEPEIDPLNFFNEKKDVKPSEPEDNELNDLLGLIEEDNKKEEKKEDKKEKNDSESSESEEENRKKAEQRLLNKQLAQQKLFNNKENRVTPTNAIFKQNKEKGKENITKETIMEKLGDDFDGSAELPELNEQKKQIMLKKMRKTINKLNSLRIQKNMDSELRQIIDDKVEELKKVKGINYQKIEGTVDELILSLKQPDFYFADDEDVQQITDNQPPMDIKPKTDIDFEAFMKPLN